MPRQTSKKADFKFTSAEDCVLFLFDEVLDRVILFPFPVCVKTGLIDKFVDKALHSSFYTIL